MVEVRYQGKSEPQRVRDELKNKPSLRASSITEQTHRTIVTVYHASSQAVSDRGYAAHDPIGALERAKAALGKGG
jgi:hypothetical protein